MHQLGVGVLGPVYRCFDAEGDRLVALKAFHLDLTPEQALGLAAALETLVAGAVTHSSVVAPLGAGVAEGRPYLAMEYVAAESLDVTIRRYAPAAPETALPFVIQLAGGLDAAHRAGLRHGALHLRDVFVSPSLAQVTGLGVVPLLEEFGLRGPLRRPYTAPEQIAGAGWSAAADRYALAAITYELLTGKRPAGAGAPVVEHLAEVVPAERAARLSHLFAAALAERPDARPATATGFGEGLAEALDWSGPEAEGPSAPVVLREEPADRPRGDDAVRVPAGAAASPSNRDAAGTHEGATRMARWKPPSSEQPPPPTDWTERPLDRGEPESLRTRGGYAPGPIGAPRDRAAEERLTPDLDELDAPLSRTDADLGPDGGLDEADAPTLLDREADHEETLEDVQARYRDTLEEQDEDQEDSQAAHVYEAITLSDLEDRAEDPDDGDPRYDDEDAEEVDRDLPTVVVPDGRYAPLTPSATELTDDGFELEAEHHDLAASEIDAEEETRYEDEDEVEDDPDDVTAGALPAGWAGEGRRLPWAALVLAAVVVSAAAFALGLGWMGGDESVEGTVADTTTAEAGAAPDPAPSPAARQPLSEGTVDLPAGAARVTPGPTAPPEPLAAPAARAPAPAATPRRAEPVPPAPAPRPVAATPPPPPVVEGRLLVRTTPPGVRVEIDGAPRGITPLAVSGLAAGSYQVRLVGDGYAEQEHRLEITADSPIASLHAELTARQETRSAALGVGSIFVDTRPRGSEVWLDGRQIGETPMLIPDVSAGSHLVEFRQDGYRDWSTTVQVGSSGQARVTASLDHAR